MNAPNRKFQEQFCERIAYHCVWPTLSDFGLYKCPLCGKMVMGYEKENHVREGHGGVQVE